MSIRLPAKVINITFLSAFPVVPAIQLPASHSSPYDALCSIAGIPTVRFLFRSKGLLTNFSTIAAPFTIK